LSDLHAIEAAAILVSSLPHHARNADASGQGERDRAEQRHNL